MREAHITLGMVLTAAQLPDESLTLYAVAGQDEAYLRAVWGSALTEW